MSGRIISGNRSSEDLIRAYLINQGKIPRTEADSDPAEDNNAGTTTTVPPIITPPNIQNGSYHLDRSYIHDHTTADYRTFLRDAGYGDLDSCSHIEIAKNVLKLDSTVTEAARRAGISVQANGNNYVASINQINGRKLVESMGHKLLTTQLMYGMFIPYIKDLAQNGNAEAQLTLDEMTNKAEWLEDLVKDKKKVCIGTKEKKLSLPDRDGRFDRQDIGEFGYPTSVKAAGEFHYWYPRGDEIAAIRSWFSVLGLILNGEPSVVGGGLGVRPQKIFT